MDRWRAPSMRTQLLVVVSITAAVELVLYLGFQGQQVPEPPPPAALAACDDALRAMKSASDRTVSAVAQPVNTLANASVRLDHAAFDHPQLDTLVQAMRHAKNEVEAGQLHGYWGKALVKECQKLS